MQNMNKVIIDNDNGSGVLPYLPLPELKNQQTSKITEGNMSKKYIILLALAISLLIGTYNTLFFVEQRIQAIVLQFGEPIKVIRDPGLNFKLPFCAKCY